MSGPVVRELSNLYGLIPTLQINKGVLVDSLQCVNSLSEDKETERLLMLPLTVVPLSSVVLVTCLTRLDPDLRRRVTITKQIYSY